MTEFMATRGLFASQEPDNRTALDHKVAFLGLRRRTRPLCGGQVLLSRA
jgi:hypothetical protein